MRSLSTLALALVATGVTGQSHMPQTYGGKNRPEEAVTFQQNKVVPIVVGNNSGRPMRFDIEVNGVIVDTTEVIGDGVKVRIPVPIKLTKLGMVENFEICSITKPDDFTETYRLRMCTRAKLLWAERK